MKVKGKTSALIAACAGIFAGAFVSGCADMKATPPHEHTYNESEWLHDDAGHWRGAVCGHRETKNYGEHVYDGAADADCNVCGRLRKIEEIKYPAESNGEKPEEVKGASDEKAEGFIIGKNTDGLIVEGISAEYELSTERRALNFDALEYAVYLSENGAKSEEVPPEYYETTVYYGGNKVFSPQELTDDGQYTVSIKLVGAVYAEGENTDADDLSVRIEFKVKNGVKSFSLTEGRTGQVSSLNDKMSATWKFEAVRANGDKFTFDGSDAELVPPDTETVGTRTTTVKYAGIVKRIEYTVNPVPGIVDGGVEITAKSGADIETDLNFVRISTDDFDVEYSVNAGYDYSVKTVLVCNGEETESLELETGESVHHVTVRVTFTYTVEGETITKVYPQSFEITVRKKPQNINLPHVYGGAEIMSGDGAVRLNAQDGFTASVNDGALEIRNSKEEYGLIYTGLVIDVEKPATVKLNIAVADGAYCGVTVDGDDLGEGQDLEGEQELTFVFAESGENTIYILANNEFDLIIIKGVEIIYGE